MHHATSGRRGLPFGATAAYIYSYVGPVNPADPRFEGAASRAKFQILFPDTVASGAMVRLSACRVNARCQQSLGSTPVSFTLQCGALPAAA